MVATAEIAAVIAERLRHHAGAQCRAGPGDGGQERRSAAAGRRGRRGARSAGADRASVITPNLPEAACWLAGPYRRRWPTCDDAVRGLASARVADWVLLKGGHLTGRDSTDLLFDGQTITELAGSCGSIHETPTAPAARSRPRLRRCCRGSTWSRRCDEAKAYLTAATRRERSSDSWRRPRAGAPLPCTLDGGHRAMTGILRRGLAAHSALAPGDRRAAVQHRAGGRHAQPRALPRLHRPGCAVSRAVFARRLRWPAVKGPDAETLRAFAQCALEAVAVEQALA